MPVTGINHYNLRASRALLEELRAFYEDVVGLKMGYRPPFKSFGYWLYIGNQDVLHLTEASVSELRHSHVCGTFDHIAFSCTELEEAKKALNRAGIRYGEDTVPSTQQIQLFFNDPAGNGVELNFTKADAQQSLPPDVPVAASRQQGRG